MNVQLLSSDIVRRVHHSPDSVTNLEEVVANLIRYEMERSENIIRKSLKAGHWTGDKEPALSNPTYDKAGMTQV